jgi:hypothetical protein
MSNIVQLRKPYIPSKRERKQERLSMLERWLSDSPVIRAAMEQQIAEMTAEHDALRRELTQPQPPEAA